MATLVATLLLIFIGGFVRVSGAGLGCPDWPLCWGSWWPPTSVGAIDASLYPVEEFNRTKMWIEYANRLVGVAVGLLVFGTFLLSLGYWRSDRWLVAGAGAAVVMVGFEGWLGGKVVESELAGGMVTVHLGGAIVLFSLLIWVTWRSGGRGRLFDVACGIWRRRLRGLGLMVFICSGVQMLLGARVREGLDLVSASGVDVGQEDLVELLGEAFTTHRSFAWLLVVLGVIAVIWLRRATLGGSGKVVVGLVPLTVVAQVLTGAAMAYLAIPGWAQVLHLGLSAVLCCVSFWMVLGFGKSGLEGADER